MRVLQHVTVAILLIVISACAALTRDASLSGQGESIIKPDTEQRSFRYLRLDNGLKVLLVSDPGADKAGASLDVNVGSRQDPRDYQGLAHFLEHMLFLGTRAYPKAGDYQAYITANGGSHNAFTSFEHTNYFFDVKADALEGALDQFSQFFVAPLFNANYVQREVNAVESEYRARLRNDRRRELAVFKEQLAPQHPFSKFSVGNLQTLQADREAALREQLLAFYQRYYSANIMSLTVVGRESLAELESMVRARFSAIENREVNIEPITQPLFEPQALPRWVTIQPVQTERRLSIQFPVVDASPHWRDKPLSYIANLLGHEGKGSLLSALKRAGWADGLSAGQSLDMQGQAMFGVNIALTEAGMEHLDSIVQQVFAYVRLIDEQGIQAWRYREQSQLAAQQFRFRNRRNLTEELVQFSSALQQYPPAEVLRAAYVMTSFRPELIREYLRSMTPDKAFITLVAPGVGTDRREQRYDVPWSARDIDAQQQQRWREAEPAGLHLPASNPYIADTFTLKGDAAANDQPRLVDNAPIDGVWLYNDDQFDVPKGRSYLLLETPATRDSSSAAAATELWLRMVSDQLNEEAYAAQLAGLDYSLSSSWRGVELRLGGFDQKQAELLSQVLNTLRHVDWDEQRFARIKQQRLRELQNVRRRSPYQQLFAELPRLQQRQEPALESLLSETEALGLADVARQAERVLAAFRYQVLLHGNFTQADALDTVAQMMRALPQTSLSTRPQQQIVKLPEGNALAIVPAEHNDAALLQYVQAPDQGKIARVALGLAAQIMSADFYHQLRTEKQLGYVVNAGVYPQRNVGGLFFLVQSPVAGAAMLAKEIDGYIDAWIENGVDEQTYEQFRATLISKLAEQPENLWEAADRHWRDLLEGYSGFDSRDQLIAALTGLEYTQWWSLMRQTLHDANRRSLLVTVPGQWPSALPAGESRAVLDRAGVYSFD
ncbi:insulinase family protein [Spongiibacter marinus]|uniref:insulinase family protein n=1 Tax=Spongiibacter marinus TaxID=354246 RepID=UPI00356713BA